MQISFLLALLVVCSCASQAMMTTAKDSRYVGGGICKNVCVVGATHGNELHGVYFVDEFNHPDVSNEMKEKYPTIDLKSIIANPNAVMAAGTGAGLRYCEVDLNRCFLVKDLLDSSITTMEGLRAKEIDQELGPKSSPNPRTDFIFDIHSSTSNTGILLCCHPDDTFAWQLVAYLQHKYPQEITACLWSEGEVPLLPSVARSGMTVEVGPIAHSTANSALYHRTKDILKAGLAYIEMHNLRIQMDQSSSTSSSSTSSAAAASATASSSSTSSTSISKPLSSFSLNQIPVKVRFFERVASVGFPRDAQGKITALIHPTLQGQPELMENLGVKIRPGQPIFQTIFKGEDILYGENIYNTQPGFTYRVERASVNSSEFTAEISRSPIDMESQRGLTEVGIKRSRELVSSGSISGIIDRESSGLTKMSSPMSKRTSSSSSSYVRSSRSILTPTVDNDVEDKVGVESIQKNQKVGIDREGNSRFSSSRNSQDIGGNGNDNGIIPTSSVTASGGGGGGGSGSAYSTTIKTTTSIGMDSVATAEEELYPMFINEAAYNEKDVAFVLMRRIERTITIITADLKL